MDEQYSGQYFTKFSRTEKRFNNYNLPFPVINQQESVK